MKLSVYSEILSDHATGEVEVSDAVFATPFNKGLIHEVVVAYMAGGRSGTKANKNRADVRGGGKKPRRQKGSGMARLGTTSSPILRGGGVTFSAVPRDFSKKVNRKAYRHAMRSLVSCFVRQGRLKVLERFGCDEPKTKVLAKQFSSGSWLVVTDDLSENVVLASRNIPLVKVVGVDDINPVALSRYDNLVITQPVLSAIEERLS